ncbi:hypothetical protein ABFS82_10G141900 [Erythranthe guttata]
MAESQKGDSSSVNMKEKNSLLDMDIGKDFLTSWKSMAEGDGMDFDLTPVTKGNKKSFQFDKADMDFNLDADFGKMSSFNMDMSDLDISPPLKKDAKSKESKESSSGKNKGKNDRFTFAFDFDELDKYNFDSSPAKEDSKARRDKDNKESFLNGSACQDKEDAMHMNLIGNTSTLEEVPQKESVPGTEITFDIDSLVEGSADLEPTRKNCPSNLAMDDGATSEHSAVIDEVAYDKAKIIPEATIAPMELSKTSRFKNLVSSKGVDLEAHIGTDPVHDLSFDTLSKNEPNGGNSSETKDKSDSIDTNGTVSNGEKDVNMISISGSTYNYEHTMSDNPQPLQTIAIPEKNSGEKTQAGLENRVMDNREKTERGQVSELVEKSRTTSDVSKVLCDTPPGRENQENASKTLNLSLVSKSSQPADQLEKETKNRRENLVTCSRFFIQAQKLERPVQKVSTQTTFSSLSSNKMGSIQPGSAEGRRDRDSVQSDRKLVSLPLQDSKTLLRREPPQIRSKESSKVPAICGEVSSADGLQNRNKRNDPSTTEKEDMVKTKPAPRQTEARMKDLDTLSSGAAFPCSSMEMFKKSAFNSGHPRILMSPTTKLTSLEEHALSSIERGRKTSNPHGLKLSGLSLESTKSPVRKDTKSVGNSCQNRVLPGKTPSDIARIPDSQKKAPSPLPLKRKTLEDNGSDIIALHPSKRLSHSPTANRNLMDASEKFLDKKVPSTNIKENDRSINSKIGNCQVSTLHIPHEAKIKDFEMSTFSIQNDNVKQAEAYGKELDHLCNMLRKKHDEAKEILVGAIVNSNKMLLLNNPLFDEKIRATQDLFARLALDGIHG